MQVKIIVPWFGRFPPWMEYFLLSCRKNPAFHWMIFSDETLPVPLPENVEFIEFSLGDFNLLASKALGMDISLTHPYKICDFRPAFGLIFNSFLEESDFWAYSDLDLIYGRISDFLSEDDFNAFDVLSVRKDYVAGHFCLYRNSELTNTLFRRSGFYGKVFRDFDHHYAFDERSRIIGTPVEIASGAINDRKLFFDRGFDSAIKAYRYIRNKRKLDINSIIIQADKKKEIKLFKKDLVRSDNWFIKKGQDDWKIQWEDGVLTDLQSGKEFLHFHFLKSKLFPEFNVELPGGANSFLITRKGISPCYSE